MSKFTPGEWTIKRDGDGWPFVRVAPGRHITIEGNSFNEVFANARLIEKAPKMYLILRALIEVKGIQWHLDKTCIEIRALLDEIDGK